MGSHSGPPCDARGNSAITVAPTVIITGRSRMMPASSNASINGAPSACFSSMKSNNTMMWLTITPTRLTIPRNAMKPNGWPLVQSAANPHPITSRHLALQLLELRACRFHDFRRQSPVGRHRRHGNRPKLITRTHLLGLHPVFKRRHLAHVNLLRSLAGIDVQIVQVAELRAFFHAQLRNHRNLLVTFTQLRNLMTRHRRLRRHRDVIVRQAGIVGPLLVSLETNCKTLLTPIVTHAIRDRRLLQDRADTVRVVSQRADVFPAQTNRHP